MKCILGILLSFLIIGFETSAQPVVPHFRTSRAFNDTLHRIVQRCLLDSSFDVGDDGMEKISFAVISLNTRTPLIGGFNMDNFIYPASVYKMYVAMEILNQVSERQYSLYDPYIVKAPNAVDLVSEIKWDPRPLLRAGDTVTINYLLDLMITRSDNSAANCLIDIAGRPAINATMHQYGWIGSEITRKFLSRKFEDRGYDTIRGTETNARHAAEFMYRIFTNSLVNPWVSRQMKSFLGRQLDTTKLGAGLPHDAMFYHKTGWWSYYTNDVGIVESKSNKFIIALFTPVPEERVRKRMRAVAESVYQLLLDWDK